MQARKVVAMLLVLGVLGLSGCGPERTFPPPAPTLADEWTMRLAQTGGFAGVSLLVQVTSDGSVSAEDRRTGRSAMLRLSPEELAELEALRQALPSQPMGRLPSVCADCFIYDLEVVSSTRTLRVQADDTTLASSGAQSLIEYLRALRDRALSSTS